MKNNFFEKFVPKEDKFFPLLSQMADVILVAANLIVECVQVKTYEESVEYFKKIKDIT